MRWPFNEVITSITWTGSLWRAHVWTRKGYSSATLRTQVEAFEWAELTARSEA